MELGSECYDKIAPGVDGFKSLVQGPNIHSVIDPGFKPSIILVDGQKLYPQGYIVHFGMPFRPKCIKNTSFMS